MVLQLGIDGLLDGPCMPICLAKEVRADFTMVKCYLVTVFNSEIRVKTGLHTVKTLTPLRLAKEAREERTLLYLLSHAAPHTKTSI